MFSEYKLELDHALEDYMQVEVNVFYGLKEIKDFKCKALIWLPKKPNFEPCVYLLLDRYKVYEALKALNKISLSVTDTTMLQLKNLRVTAGNFDITGSKKGYVKLHHASFIVTYSLPRNEQTKKFTFKITDSELLQSKIYSYPKYKIALHGFEHLAISSIRTDDIIEENILHIETVEYIDSYYAFRKKLEPLINLILNLASFAERRRLTWSSCECSENGLAKYYHCRKLFYNDKKVYRLISDEIFDDFLSNSLKNISKENIYYFNKILNCINRSRNYPTDAKIIVLSTALEIILKKHFGIKRDKHKKDLIKKLGILTFDLPDMQKLIDIRNDLTHGDEVSSRNQFLYAEKWKFLLERMVLNELGWSDLSMTDVHYIKGHMASGLV